MIACTAAVAVLLAASPVPAEPTQTAVTHAGMLLRGKLSSDDALPAFRVESAESISLEQIRRISFNGGALILPKCGPLRRIALSTGDRFTGTLVSLDSETAVLDVRGRDRVRVPVAAIRAIEPLPNLRDRDYEDFESGDIARRNGLRARLVRFETEVPNRGLALESGTWEWPLSQPVENGQLSCWIHTEPEDRPNVSAGIEVTFGEGTTRQTVRILLRSDDRTLRIGGTAMRRLAVQPLTSRDGWQKLTVRAEERRLQILADERLLAGGERPAGAVTRVVLFREPAEPAADRESEAAAIVFDDLLMQEFDANPIATDRLPFPERDALLLRDGSRLFGDIVSANAHTATLETATGPIELDWSDLVELQFRMRKTSASQASGVLSRITLAPPSDHRPRESDELHAGVRRSTEAEIELDHPILGSLTLPLAHVQRIEPEFIGTRLLLSSGPHHLGDEVRSRFAQPRPEGSRLEGTFELGDLPSGDIELAAEVSELEPSGHGTPRGSRFLAELRAGGLLTELWINDTRVTALNNQILYRSRTGTFQRISIPVPRALLHRGTNQWRLEQRPARSNRDSFDDFEIRRIVLEVTSAKKGE